MYTFPNFEPVHCSMSGFNCFFLTCILVSQESSKVLGYSHLFKNFPQFVVIHTVKGFSTVNEAEVDVFLEFSCYFMIQRMLAIGCLVLLPFLNPASIPRSSWFTYCWSAYLITLLVCEISIIVWQFEHALALPFLGNGMKTDHFQSCGHCLVF